MAKRDWRLAGCLNDLRTELNRMYPDRAKPDGTIGDEAHQQTKSSHNPDALGVVRGLDVKEQGVDSWGLVTCLVHLGKTGDPRLAGGYVIYEGNIWNSRYGWVKRPYNGVNAHLTHVHISCTDDPANYDQRGSWGVYVPRRERTPTVPKKEDDMFVTTVNRVGWLVLPTGGRIQVVSTTDYTAFKERFGELKVSEQQLEVMKDVTVR